MKGHQADHPIATMGRVLGVSPSGYLAGPAFWASSESCGRSRFVAKAAGRRCAADQAPIRVIAMLI
jgi:hypothetical protein